MNSQRTRMLCAAALLALLASCGQKGPLTLPDHKSHKVTPQTGSQPTAPVTTAPDSGSASSGTASAPAGTAGSDKKKQDDSQPH